jgi:hypothetical protein
MKAARLVCLCLLLFSSTAHGETFEAEWDFSAEVVGDSVLLHLTNRYVACGMGARIDRVSGAQRETVFVAQDGLGLETVDPYVDCLCEPLGSSHGTGQKSCPNQDCTKDQQCACSRECSTTKDTCPEPGDWVYELYDLDENLVATAAMTLPALLPGCTAAPVASTDPEAPDQGESGGCSAATGGNSWLLLLVLLALLWPLKGRTRSGVVMVACLCVPLACSRAPAPEPKAAPVAAPKPLQASDTNFEQTPWEPVVATQTELLDFFETAQDPESALRAVTHWRRDRLSAFKEECGAALAWYAADSVHRMDYLVKAGRVWSVVKQRVTQISADWGPAEKHDVGIWLEDFECR